MTWSPRQTTTLIVAERGSDWSRWADRFGADDEAVMLQDRGESLDRFAHRVRSRVTEMAAVDDGPQRVVIVGGRAREGALAARSLMIRAVAHSMVRSGGGEVLLDNHGSDRFTMRALADTVGDMVRGSGVAVSHASEPRYAQVA
jgi:hypothetical protein